MLFKRLAILAISAASIGVAQPLSAVPPLEAEETGPSLPTPSFPIPAASGLPAVPAEEPPPAPPPGFVFWKTIRAKVTAYDPCSRCCGHSADGVTATGDDAWVLDGVATAPLAIPYRTKLWVPGAGWREADDTGSAMRRAWRRGRHLIDLRVGEHAQARRWGARDLTLHLYRPLQAAR